MLGEGIMLDPEAPPAEDYLYKHFIMRRDGVVPKILTFDVAQRCLKNLGKDESGVRYAYLVMAVADMKLTDIAKIICFRHVMVVDVSGNFLDLEAIQVLREMPFLILLKAERNRIESAALKCFPYLQVLLLGKNQITETDNIAQHDLEIMDLSNNLIYEVRFRPECLTELHQLEMVGNHLVELAGTFPTSLEKLYLAQNRISKIVASDLSKLVNLEVLHLRENKIHKLDGFTEDLKELNYLNLRKNNVRQLRQLRKLSCLPKLETLILTDNPVMGGMERRMGGEDQEIEGEGGQKDNVRILILVVLPNLKRINKEVVTGEEREEAFFIRDEKMREIMDEESSDEESLGITTTDVTTDYTTETEEAGTDQIEYGG